MCVLMFALFVQLLLRDRLYILDFIYDEYRQSILDVRFTNLAYLLTCDSLNQLIRTVKGTKNTNHLTVLRKDC